eukprot:scaffold7246_cov79-Phaeocystis_antarctica.AAC.2
MAALNGKHDCVEHLIAKGANREVSTQACAAPPHPPPSPCTLAPSAARRSCCSAPTAAADRVWRRRRASVGARPHGPLDGGFERQARLPRAPHLQRRPPETLRPQTKCVPPRHASRRAHH